MGSSAFFLSVVAAAAFRVVLGAESGINYNTTALSTWRTDDYNMPLERTPWSLQVRPDVMVAVFNQRHYGYLMGNGSFGQPFAFPSQQTAPCTRLSTGEERMCGGDAAEGVGNLMLGGRFRLGRRLRFHPGVFLSLASSNSFVESQDELSTSRIQSRPFTALYGGGFLEWELPLGRKLRLFLRNEAEAWHLGSTEGALYVPYGVRLVQPNIIITNQLTTWIDVTRRNGIALDLTVEDSIFFNKHHQPYEGVEDNVVLPEDWAPPGTEHQIGITGRVVYRRAWLPNLMTDISIGLLGLLPRESDVADEQVGEFRLPIGDWQLNLVGGASLNYFGRPRWLTLRFTYERYYDQLHFRNSGSIHDSINLMASFGPFSGFSISTTLSWSRFAVEVQRLNSSACAQNPGGCMVRQETPTSASDCDAFYDEQCPNCDSWTRNFNTVGIDVHAEYLHEFGNILLGPFFTGYVYSQIGESIPVGDEFGTDPVCNVANMPRIEAGDVDCYMPPNHDVIEAILMLGLRIQWNGGNARNPRRGQSSSGSGRSSRSDRRLELQRMTREERIVPGFAPGMNQYGVEDGHQGLFENDDPFGRMNVDRLYEDMLDEPMSDELEEALEEEEEIEEEWFGEERPPPESEQDSPEDGEGDSPQVEGEGQGETGSLEVDEEGVDMDFGGESGP